MKRMPATLLALAALGLTGTAFSAAATAAPTHRLDVPVDRQAYVTSATVVNPVDGSTIDPYNADPSVIHVGVAGGQETARSFVHLAMGYLPAHADASDAVLTLHLPQKADTSSTGTYPIYTFNNTSAIIEACALVTELPADLDPEKPPAYDCAHGSSVGKANAAGDIWTFALHDLVDYWAVHGNTGAALVPIAPDPSATWSVAFSISQSTAKVTYTVPALTPKPTRSSGGTPRPAGNGTGSNDGTTPGSAAGSSSDAGGSVGPPASAGGSLPPADTGSKLPASGSTGTVTPPAVAGSGTTPPAGAPAASHDSGSPAWPWVLLVSLVVAAGAVGVAHRAALLAFARRIVPPGLAAFRAHPRAYAVASAALAWGLVFTSYSVVTSSPSAPAEQLAGASTPGVIPPAAGTPTTPTVTGGTSGPGQAGAALTPSGGGAPAPGVTTGNSAPTGAPTTQQQQEGAAAQEFDGPGTYRTINGVQVFFPAHGGVPVAKLYSGADDTVGLSPTELRICAHAALTYGAAFNISDKDLDVFWHNVNDHGGIFGRHVTTSYQNDNYDPGTAVQAAQTCKDWGTFLLEGGIGFDQIPAVRQWAEQNHMLYLHHIATERGAAGLRYSFSALPTVEQVGTWMGQLAGWKFAGKKVGIIYRQSSNWDPAIPVFEAAAKKAGITIVGVKGTTLNQANYTQELTSLRTAGAQVVLAWENALAEIEMIKQAQAQNWHPAWLVNGFNIITNTLGKTALDQDMWSAAEWEAYDPGYYGGGFSSYAPQIKEFEAEYRKYDPKANLSGPGGDLLFLNWESQKGMYDLLTACGPTCTRNKLAGLLLAGWHKVTPPNCPADFGRTGDHHHGGYRFSVLHAVRDPNGRANFVPVQRCITSL